MGVPGSYKFLTGPSTSGSWALTYNKLFSCKPVLTVCKLVGAQSNEISTYGRVSRGTIPRVRRYGLLYLRSVEYDHCLLNSLFGRRSKKTSKLRVTGLRAGNSPVTGEFPAQMARNAENVSIWWRHHAYIPNVNSTVTSGILCVVPV